MRVILFRSRGAEITARVEAACSVSGDQIQPFNLSEEFLDATSKWDNRYRKLKRILKRDYGVQEEESDTPGA